MRADGIIPDVPIASALICAYGVLGQFTNCQRMLRATEAVTAASYAATGAFSGKYPDAKLYTEYLIAACRCGRPDAAVESFESERFPRTVGRCRLTVS